jgi:hypothetical protein
MNNNELGNLERLAERARQEEIPDIDVVHLVMFTITSNREPVRTYLLACLSMPVVTCAAAFLFWVFLQSDSSMVMAAPFLGESR